MSYDFYDLYGCTCAVSRVCNLSHQGFLSNRFVALFFFFPTETASTGGYGTNGKVACRSACSSHSSGKWSATCVGQLTTFGCISARMVCLTRLFPFRIFSGQPATIFRWLLNSAYSINHPFRGRSEPYLFPNCVEVTRRPPPQKGTSYLFAVPSVLSNPRICQGATPSRAHVFWDQGHIA